MHSVAHTVFRSMSLYRMHLFSSVFFVLVLFYITGTITHTFLHVVYVHLQKPKEVACRLDIPSIDWRDYGLASRGPLGLSDEQAHECMHLVQAWMEEISPENRT